jgi:hypothetical protein
MRKLLFTVLVILLLAMLKDSAQAQLPGYNNFCQLGGKPVVTQGLNSTTLVQSAYPKCTVTVYNTGTLTLSTINSTPGGGALANPFQANIDGSFLFFASNTLCYDVVLSPSTSGGIPVMPSNFTYTDVCLQGTGTGTVLPAAQVGDCIRFNTAGDSNWDAVNCSFEINGVYQTAQGTPVGFGTICAGNIGFATGTGNSQVFPTATRRAGVTYFITPGASTSTVVGMDCGQNGNNSIFPILAWYRFSALFSISSTTNTRYWIGLATWNIGSGTGTNSINILNSTKFATDTPNSNAIAFRYSAGTDTTFKAVTCVAGGSCTVVDSLVTADTNPHLFEETSGAAGTAICYFIDHVQVTSPCITTNIPSALGSSDGLADIFWTGDNKNTVTTPSATFYMMQLSMK